MVQIVTDKEIVEAESASTIAGFMEEHGMEYFKNVMVPKEQSDWVASYTGGFDGETGQRSESAAAFEIIWLPNKTHRNREVETGNCSLRLLDPISTEARRLGQ